ncbi:MAG: hypoxanthine phosphoribosyltransferase [Acidimicrobiia bacterium]|nr:hypoxanthine phosphoribosyltransferase [Acidimicrobiia bacterium]
MSTESIDVPQRPPSGKAPTESVGRTLVTEEQIRQRVRELGEQITRDYAGERPLLVAVLRGAYMFLADLSREIDLMVEIDFMAVSSYGNATASSGVVRILKDLDEDLEGRHVIVVEDIIDSGLTLSYLRRNLKNRAAASVEVCALLVREGRQKVDEDLKYVGFELPPDFVVGYGLDASGTFRNLPYIAEYTGGGHD